MSEGRGEETGGRDAASGKRAAALLFGRGLAAVGLVLGILGAVAASFGPLSFQSTLPTTSLGIFLRAVGYFLGARRLGIAAAVVSVLALILGFVASRGGLPFMGPTDTVT